MVIKFNNDNEFLAELERERPLKPVRITYIKQTAGNMPSTRISVVATAKSKDGDLIKLEYYCGDIWRGVQDEVQKLAEDVFHRVKKLCEDMGLEVRAGLWEPEGGVV